MRRLNPRIPLNGRTAVFCLLMGSVLSVPIGMLPQEPLFEVPERVLRAYYIFAGAAFILLPFWSDSAVRDYPPLPRLGIWAFFVLLILGAAVFLLFPQITWSFPPLQKF